MDLHLEFLDHDPIVDHERYLYLGVKKTET